MKLDTKTNEEQVKEIVKGRNHRDNISVTINRQIDGRCTEAKECKIRRNNVFIVRQKESRENFKEKRQIKS